MSTPLLPLMPFAGFVDRVAGKFDGLQPPSNVDLRAIADELRRLAAAFRFDEAIYPAALPKQELLYELAVSGSGGPSLYLVSDGAGTRSPPHEHQTWAVIVGLRGIERNTFYRAGSARHVTPTGTADVGADQFIVLQPSDIHATEVVGDAPTYHLHLYGKALAALPAFASRCFVS